jgi:hypothetical protein
MTCGSALDIKRKYGHSYLRMLGSYFIHGPKFNRANMSGKLNGGERAIIYSIHLLKYFYRVALYSGLFLRLIDPNKVRE